MKPTLGRPLLSASWKKFSCAFTLRSPIYADLVRCPKVGPQRRPPWARAFGTDALREPSDLVARCTQLADATVVGLRFSGLASGHGTPEAPKPPFAGPRVRFLVARCRFPREQEKTGFKKDVRKAIGTSLWLGFCLKMKAAGEVGRSFDHLEPSECRAIVRALGFPNLLVRQVMRCTRF